MKKNLTFFFTVILFLSANGLRAVPAYPHPIVFTQPNGDELTVMIKGDERIHWHESMDGFTLLFNPDGYLSYAQLDGEGNLQPSEFVATDIENRNFVIHSFLNTIQKKLFYSNVQKQLILKVWEIEDEYETRAEKAVIGQYKTICAFVQFPEKAMVKTMSQFEGLMNQLGYTGNGTGSVRDFFKEASYNQFDLIITLCGVYTAPNSEVYYAGSDGTSNCQQLARWLAQQVSYESDINFADYDSDNNGVVDGFHFIFAGRGQEAGGGSGTIWSHKWQFSPAVTQNGKSISVYSCSPEFLYSDITTIGVICHEMSHAFGSPDFYDTNYGTGGQYDGTGMWDIMADGSWNANGNRPSHHNMYQKVQYGWVTPVVLNAPITITNMPNSAENPVAYRINVGSGNEHYLLENRQRIKFDTNVPGNGLLIYHAHSSVGTSNINTTHPQKLYPVCAGSTVAIPVAGASNYGTINGAGCVFPGTGNKTSFTGTSTPRMFYWTNTVVNGKEITEITHSNQLISFNFMGGGALPTYTVTFNANEGTGTMSPQVFTFSMAQNLTPNGFVRTGYTFNGWNTMANGSGTSYSDKQSITISENTTLYAQWQMISVTNITNVPSSTYVGIPLTLTGTVMPGEAAYQTITWSIKEAGTTGATLTGNTLNTTGFGDAIVSATITNGIAIGVPFIKEFTVAVNKANLTGTVTINGLTIFDETLSANTATISSNPVIPNLGTFTYQWRRGTTGIGTNSPTYKLVAADIGNTITVSVTANNCVGTLTSNPTSSIIKATQEAPDAPVLLMASTTFIILKTIPGCEYRRDGGAWQTSTTFSGLTPGTTYSFQACKAETVTHFASEPSLEAPFSTTSTSTYLITASVNNAAFGTISPEGSTVVEEGESQTYSITANAHYFRTSVLVNGTENEEATSTGFYTFTNVNSDQTIHAVFTSNIYSVTFMANDGTGVMAPQHFTYGVSQNLSANTFTRENYTFKNWNTQANGQGNTYENEQNISIENDITLFAQWKAISSVEYTIVATAGHGGEISPSGDIKVLENGTQIFTIKAEESYTIVDVLVDGLGVGAVEEYPFENVTDNHTIHAIFDYVGIVENNVTSHSIQIIPNPANEMIQLRITNYELQNENIKFYNSVGQLVKSVLCNGEIIDNLMTQQISVADFSEGIYWIKVGKHLGKMIKY